MSVVAASLGNNFKGAGDLLRRSWRGSFPSSRSNHLTA